ncbi:hypothetical protein HFK89_24700 [Ralstonia pseudosolanacearum]|uniref:hypothetical protein n=1 Tax=Ralstonia pseudosolanacearum TaxID=1310165 RepID=UPI001113AF5A|nr:hypothetical protein [Ralstonia pseudosolanacearum]MCK4165545.1 hypothetical protein [Ralstonia pseudosolanacearum]
MGSYQLQGLVVAAWLIGCTIFAITLCIKVLPSPMESLNASEQSDHQRHNHLVLGWVVLACAGLVAGHVVAYRVMASEPVCTAITAATHSR